MKFTPSILIGLTSIVTAIIGVVYFYSLSSDKIPKTRLEIAQSYLSDYGCVACHQAGNMFRAPELEGLYGIKREFKDGIHQVATDEYIMESILYPERKVVKGYSNNMPSYKGQIPENHLKEIIFYIKSTKSK